MQASKAIELERRADDAAVAHAAQTVADAITVFLREHPTQWFHFVD